MASSITVPADLLGPAWLKPLLKTAFFTQCSIHTAESNKCECNLFCLDCAKDPLCSACTSYHRTHRIVQIRRSSYHDVIRVSEIQKYLDLSGVQSYIINSARVVFLNQRPQPRHAKGVTNTCQICDRSLLDTFKFCSLGCKLEWIQSHYMTKSIMPPPPPTQQKVVKEREVVPYKKKKVRTTKTLNSLQECGADEQQHSYTTDTSDSTLTEAASISPHTPPRSLPMRSPKRRKGVPHRAPMSS